MTDENGQDNPYYQVNTYLSWVQTEGVPIVDAYAVDCLTQPLEPAPRVGGLGAYIHLAGRGDAATCYLALIFGGARYFVSNVRKKGYEMREMLRRPALVAS